MQGLKQAINNLNELGTNLVPKATTQAVNRVAHRVISRSTRLVAKETGVSQKLIRQRARIRLATSSRDSLAARLIINRGNLPAINLGTARFQLSRRNNMTSRRGSVLKIGHFTFRHAFIQQLANGRWHVMQRTGRGRYPLQVVKIPLSAPLTKAYQEETHHLVEADLPRELVAALRQQVRLYLNRTIR
ncbi:phage tail protein [uncultured Pantoea sp.]|uniref:phage tail protein n=1 Tax=uncultured Pantoea sp. TaxID=218084 RepID=UPI0026006D19|nr:phage tail protein [uncultured Pantoea sp.]